MNRNARNARIEIRMKSKLVFANAMAFIFHDKTLFFLNLMVKLPYTTQNTPFTGISLLCEWSFFLFNVNGNAQMETRMKSEIVFANLMAQIFCFPII